MAEDNKKEGILVIDPNGAPIIFFDGATNFGNAQGVINVTLAASRRLAQNQAIAQDAVAVAFLRCSIPAATELRHALDQALLLSAPVQGEGKAN